ncbi:hypothetical protein AB4Z27_15510 [Cupriavidus sp. KB_39]|uniref:hypothetical protein n=1 Tax=Cupriavidus sp. KB_39 TaxID=3233036 RepID=UPI003F918086
MDAVVMLTQQDAVELVNRLSMVLLVVSFCGALGALMLWDALHQLVQLFGDRRRQRRKSAAIVRRERGQ